MPAEWRRENYEESITSRAWGATPYDAGWDGSRKHGEDLPASAELRAIFDFVGYKECLAHRSGVCLASAESDSWRLQEPRPEAAASSRRDGRI